MIAFTYGQFTCCLTCEHRRRWSTGKTHSAYCRLKSQGKTPRMRNGLLGWACDRKESAPAPPSGREKQLRNLRRFERESRKASIRVGETKELEK